MDLKHIRKATLGLTQEALGRALGIDQAQVSRIENGAQPLDTRTRLAVEALVVRKNAGLPLEVAA